MANSADPNQLASEELIVLGFNDTSTLEGHFVSSPREREKRDRRESRGDEREGQGRKRNRNESEETDEIKTFPLYPNDLDLPVCKGRVYLGSAGQGLRFF